MLIMGFFFLIQLQYFSIVQLMNRDFILNFVEIIDTYLNCIIKTRIVQISLNMFVLRYLRYSMWTIKADIHFIYRLISICLQIYSVFSC
jgi:hypothetical protein